MGMTKAERRKLGSLRKGANKLAKDALKLARRVDREMERQMRKS